MLEHQCGNQKGEEICPPTTPTPSTPTKTVPNIMGSSLKYLVGTSIPQQPMFLASILSALQLVNMYFQYSHTYKILFQWFSSFLFSIKSNSFYRNT